MSLASRCFSGQLRILLRGWLVFFLWKPPARLVEGLEMLLSGWSKSCVQRFGHRLALAFLLCSPVPPCCWVGALAAPKQRVPDAQGSPPAAVWCPERTGAVAANREPLAPGGWVCFVAKVSGQRGCAAGLLRFTALPCKCQSRLGL